MAIFGEPLIDQLLLQQDKEFEKNFESPNESLDSTIASTPEPDLMLAGLEMLHSSDPRRRILGIRLAKEVKHFETLVAGELNNLLHREHNEDVICWTVDAFGVVKSELATEQLLKLASHTDPVIRFHVCAALANHGSFLLPQASIDALTSLTSDADSEVRYSAVFELGVWWRGDRDPDIEAVLRRVAESDTAAEVATAARDALG
jgi:hypothetical protein